MPLPRAAEPCSGKCQPSASARSATAPNAGAMNRAYSCVMWPESKYTNMFPTIAGQRLSVQNSSVRSAY